MSYAARGYVCFRYNDMCKVLQTFILKCFEQIVEQFNVASRQANVVEVAKIGMLRRDKGVRLAEIEASLVEMSREPRPYYQLIWSARGANGFRSEQSAVNLILQDGNFQGQLESHRIILASFPMGYAPNGKSVPRDAILDFIRVNINQPFDLLLSMKSRSPAPDVLRFGDLQLPKGNGPNGVTRYECLAFIFDCERCELAEKSLLARKE